MTLHVVSLPHTQTTPEYDWCAFTSKVRRFCRMMTDVGQDVVLYCGDENSVQDVEVVCVVFKEDRERWFGAWNGVDAWWDCGLEIWNESMPWWQTMNVRTADAVRQRMGPDDILCLIGGTCQKPIAEALPELPAVEWGIGYEGFFARYRVWESYAWRHYLSGRYSMDCQPEDTVIPNAFYPDDFICAEGDEGYLLFMGRMIERKGLGVVGELAKKYQVVTAGQGSVRVDGAHHVGVVHGAFKAELLAKAKAVLCPSVYVEPFGAVSVEAQMSGTPVLASAWGGFVENVVDGVTGFLCNDVDDYVAAAENLDQLSPEAIRKSAVDRYSCEVVAPMFERYFKRVLSNRAAD
jgi:glycosyltransferase involved in cell wall biosynthesis